VTQPVLDRFGRAPDVFVFEGADRRDVLLFAALCSVVPVAALSALETAVGRRARGVVHLALVAAAAWLVAVNAAKTTLSISGLPAAFFATAAAAVAGVAYARSDAARQFLRFGSAGLPVFLAIFLLVSPVSDLVRTGSVALADDVDLAARPPIVMIVFDELPLASLVDRDGEIDADAYPGFARLAALTTSYRNTTAVSGTTWYSVPSILTGRLPTGDANPLVTDWPDNLFTVLGDGYRYEVQEAVTSLCPTRRCSRDDGRGLRGLVRRGVDLYADVVAPGASSADPQATFAEGADPEVEFDAFERFQPGRFSRFLDRLGAADQPAVHYLHLLLPHTPWRLLPSGLSYPPPERAPGQADGRWSAGSEWPALQARQRHLLQVRYVDGLVGQLLDRMEETGLLDEAVLIVTADHGVAFRPGQPVKGNKEEDVSAVGAILPEMAWVPLFVRAPGGRAGAVDDRNALLVDVLPTIAEIVGLEPPDGVDGRSLLGEPRSETGKPWFQSYDSDFFGVVAGGRSELPSSRRAEVFALAAGTDPYAIGPRPDLIGRDVNQLVVGEPADVEPRLDRRPFSEVDLSSGVVPAVVSGSLSADPGPGAAVAIALNGRVAAVSPVFRDLEADAAFVGLVPDGWFRDGANDLRLFLVSHDPGDLAARPIPVGRP